MDISDESPPAADQMTLEALRSPGLFLGTLRISLILRNATNIAEHPGSCSKPAEVEKNGSKFCASGAPHQPALGHHWLLAPGHVPWAYVHIATEFSKSLSACVE